MSSTITSNVTTLLVNSSNISLNSPYVAYVSSVTTPGRIATVRDAVGLVSSPSRLIVISTLKDVLFSDGTSSLTIYQPYGSLSIISRDKYTWDILNTYAFPAPTGITNVSSLVIKDGIIANSITAKGYISSHIVYTNSVSSLELYTSTLSSATLNANTLSANVANISSAIISTVSTNNSLANFFVTNILSSVYTQASLFSSMNTVTKELIVQTLNTQTINTSTINVLNISTNTSHISSINAINLITPIFSTIHVNSIHTFASSIYITSLSSFNNITNIFNTSSIILSNNSAYGTISMSADGSKLYFNNAEINYWIPNANGPLNMNGFNLLSTTIVTSSLYTNNLYSLSTPNINIYNNINMNNNSITNINTLSSLTANIGNIQFSTNNVYDFKTNYELSNSAIDILSASHQSFTNTINTTSIYNLNLFLPSITTSNENNILYTSLSSTQKIYKIDYSIKASILSNRTVALYLSLTNSSFANNSISNEYRFDQLSSNVPIYPQIQFNFDTGFYDINISGTDTIIMDLDSNNYINMNLYPRVNNFILFATLINNSNIIQVPNSYIKEDYTYVGYGGHTFISGSSNIYYSIDNGNSWNVSVNTLGNTTRCAAYGNGIWVVGGASNSNKTMSYSLDGGKIFNPCVSQPIVDYTNSVTFGKNTFVATGNKFASTIMYSYDGKVWNPCIGPMFFNYGTKVKYANNIFIAIGNDTLNPILRSVDGIVWSNTSWVGTQLFDTSSNANTLTYGYGTWYVAGANGSIAVSSDNGVNWSDSGITYFNGYTITSICMAELLYVSTSNAIGNNVLFASSDYGSNWTPILNSNSFTSISDIICENGKYVFVGATSNGIMTAPVQNIINYSLKPVYPQPLYSSNASFSPSSITGLALWLDAADSNTLFQDVSGTVPITSTGQYVLCWKDKSSFRSNATQNISTTYISGTYRTLAPTYNSNGVYFVTNLYNNVNDSLQIDQNYMNLNVPYTIDYTVFLVARNIQNFESYFYGAANVGGNGPTIIQGYNDNDIKYFNGNEGGTIASNPTPSFMVGYTRKFDFINGVYINTYYYGSNTATIPVTNTTIISGWNVLGNSVPSQELYNFLNGIIYEFIIYNFPLNDVQRKQVEGYLAWKWGFQGYLSPNHPYKSIPLAQPLFNSPNIPQTISDLALWLDATDHSTIILNNSNVVQWNDKSSNGTNGTCYGTLTYTSNAINNKPAIYFPGSVSSYIRGNLVNNGTQLSVFAVSILNGGGGAAARILSLGVPNVDDYDDPRYVAAIVTSGDTNNIQSHRNNIQSITPTFNYGSPMIVYSGFNGSINEFFLYGNIQYTFNNSSGNFGYSNYQIGLGFTSGSSDGTQIYGYVSEVIVYHKALNTYERQQVEGYLAWKYGLQSNLPNTHPFKTIPFLDSNIPTSITTSFLPTNINSGNCILWLDALDTNTLTLNSSNKVLGWTDKSGYGSHINTSAGLAYASDYLSNGFNNLPTVMTDFYPSSGRLNGNFGINVPSSSYYTILMVANFIGASADNNCRFIGIQPSGGNDFQSGFNFNIYNNRDPYVFTSESEVGYGEMTSAFFSNSTSPGPSIITFSNIVIQSFKPFAYGLGTVSFNTTSDNNICSIAFSEVLIYSGALTSNDIYKVQSYLSWKWGLQKQLRLYNPYKNNPP